MSIDDRKTPEPRERGVAAGSGGRELSSGDLAYLNRMTVTGHVLPNVAHELNNSLQVVSGLVEMLAGRSDLPADVRDKVSRIGAQSARAVWLMRELVAFARRDDHGVRAFDLGRVVEQALSLRRYHLSRARISVAVEREEQGPFRVRGDAHAVEQILLNLVINAEQALAGRNDPRITIALDVRDGFVELSVIDNGPGMALDLARKAQEPFFTTRAGMCGLGLPVARHLAESLGGRLDIEPKVEGGTRAVLWLPRVED